MAAHFIFVFMAQSSLLFAVFVDGTRGSCFRHIKFSEADNIWHVFVYSIYKYRAYYFSV